VGQQEFIKPGENGYVFPAEDVEALSACMEEILEAPEKFPQLSRNSRQTFLDNFELNKASGAIRKVFDDVKKYL
jgi:glycosyltransferase involved in cell wall biosynthesis